MIHFDQLNDSGPSLAKALSEHLPQHRGRRGWVSMRLLASALKVSAQTVSRWLNENEIPPNRVGDFLKLPGNTLTKEILLTFVDFGEK